MPTPGQVHVDQPLTNVSIAFMQSMDAFVSGQAEIQLPVDNKSDVYTKYPLESFTSSSAQVVGDGDETPEVDYDTEEDSYLTQVHGAHGEVGDQTRGNADSQFDLEQETTEQVTRDLMLEKEQDWHNTFFDTGIWDTDIDVSSTLNAWDTSNGTPIEDITAEIETVEANTGFRPNTFVATAPVIRSITNNSNFIDRVKHTQLATQNAMRNALANVLDVDNVLQTRAVINSAQEGEAADVDYVNSADQALLAYVPDSPGLRTPSAMYTFTWENAFQGQATEMGLGVDSFRDRKTRSDWIEGLMAYDSKVISSALAVFFHNALS